MLKAFFIHTVNLLKNKAVIVMKPASPTIDPDEISRFAKDAPRWWDESGPFAPLHRLNPARLGFIRDALCSHYGRDPADLHSLKGLKILDVGCGGGLVSEPLARLGAAVTGIDGDTVAISVAHDHGIKSGIIPPTQPFPPQEGGRAREGGPLVYMTAATTDLAGTYKNSFDAVLALEIVEHVSDIDLFVRECVSLCKPGGIVIFSTLNKTFKSFALGKVAAEYLLRWVPAGTHDWKKFVRPSTLARALRDAGATPRDAKGLIFNPLQNNFAVSETDLDVNYFMTAIKEKP